MIDLSIAGEQEDRGLKLALLGNGGFAKELAEVARLKGCSVTGVYSTRADSELGPYKGYLDQLLADHAEYDGVLLAIGGVSRKLLVARSHLVAWLQSNRITCPSLVSPHSIISPDVSIAAGVFVAHGVIVNAGSQLNAFSALNTAAIIGHDTVIGKNTMISPGAFVGGRCRIGDNCLIGPLAKVYQGLAISDEVTVGMGCNVFRALPAGATVWPKIDTVSRATLADNPV